MIDYEIHLHGKETSIRKVTLNDVAREAGVALGTASRVLNNRPNVNEEARNRVLNAAKKLNYVSLRKRKGQQNGSKGKGEVVDKVGNIGVVIFGMERSFVQLPITAEALQGVERQISRCNRNMLLANMPKLEEVPGFISDPNVEGLILRCAPAGNLPSEEESEFIRLLSRFPTVWLFTKPESMPGDACGYDTARAVSLVIEHFREMGHERIGFLNPRPGNLLLEQLKKHFFFAAEKVGLDTRLLENEVTAPVKWPLPAIHDVRYVRPLLEKWQRMPRKNRPTGLFIGADSAAVQLYLAAEAMKLRVGKDLSIISCNHEKSLTNLLSPRLTTVDIFSEMVGQVAVDQLMWRLRNPEITQGMRVLVEPKMVHGDSVRKLK